MIRIIWDRTVPHRGDVVVKLMENGVETARESAREDPAKAVKAGVYTGCSLTTMRTKGYLGVYLPDEQTGRSGIFMHHVGKASPHKVYSKGCAITYEEFMETVAEAAGFDRENITVEIRE